MNVVIVGDIGWRYLYHLGDEAMTEAAVDMLRARGIDDLVLVAGEPSVATDFYKLPAVSRVGFKSSWSRSRNDRVLASVADTLAQEMLPPDSIYTAIRDSDAVVIAGGGNMNSRDYHLLYERVATARIAHHFSKPLYVTSQTVGPMLSDSDRALVVEIAEIALAFGCRESTSAALVRRHVKSPEKVHHTLDDAVVLASDDEARVQARELSGPGPYVVASFTDHHGTVWPNKKAYLRDLSILCRTIAEDHDVDVVLAPHAGSLDPSQKQRDQISNTAIVELAQSSRVRATRMITAREDVALVEGAALSLSTRYHPAIFAIATATPAIAIAPSYYSSIRMRGAMRNVGFERFAIPASAQHLLRDAVGEALSRTDRYTTALRTASVYSRELQSRWWDALVASIQGVAPVKFDEGPGAATYAPSGQWSHDVETIVPIFDNYARTLDRVSQLKAELQSVRAEADATADTLARYRDRKVIRGADRVGRLIPRSRS
ncbi:polysaccharide pyruvyl transferase family protein [Demequina flava]|uniref:polysaccharide pyruvyl transferase family protein n=1 Tax=Demequina flava TaxID=1095025 RepID=UPI000785DE89|nr:polysaccharide pyruvyl transferase family protein [Demequina flava]